MIRPVAHAGVWRSIKVLYLGAAALFLVNIALGIWNVFTEGELPVGQRLAHLHAGSIGWITLSIIATALWTFTGQRQVSDGYARWTSAYVWTGLALVAGYVAAFYLAFNGTAPFWLLVLFGVPTALVIWAGFLYTWSQLGNQGTVTTAHLLLFGALLVASLAATMGVLRGLDLGAGIALYPAGNAVEPVGAHAGPMDMYLALGLAAVVELSVRPGSTRWSRWGMTQMVLGVLGGLLTMTALYAGIEPLIPMGMLAFLASFLVYMVRMGWRPFTSNPLAGPRRAAVFWGGLAFPAYIAFFVTFVFVFIVPEKTVPHAFGVSFTHIAFVGLATNLLLATHSSYASGPGAAGRTELAGIWLLNLGLLAFITGEYMAQRPDGALVMALGVLIALGAIVARMLKAQEPSRFELAG